MPFAFTESIPNFPEVTALFYHFYGSHMSPRMELPIINILWNWSYKSVRAFPPRKLFFLNTSYRHWDRNGENEFFFEETWPVSAQNNQLQKNPNVWEKFPDLNATFSQGVQSQNRCWKGMEVGERVREEVSDILK